MSELIEYFTNNGKDHQGRTLDEVLAYSDGKIEATHDVIQWMFPLHERSMHSRYSPVLDTDDIKAVQSSPVAQANMKKTLERFSKFLGIGQENDEKKQKFWCSEGNHNLLRITRVIRSLRLFGMEKEAAAFYKAVVAIAKTRMLSPKTTGFWARALEDTVTNSMTDRFLQMRRIDVR